LLWRLDWGAVMGEATARPVARARVAKALIDILKGWDVWFWWVG
jgi:hypothetical protein